MDSLRVLQRAMTIICTLLVAALLSGSSAFAQDAATGGSSTRTGESSSPGTADQTVRQRPIGVIGETDTTTTSGHQERRRERPRESRQDKTGTGTPETPPRQPPVSDSSPFKAKLDQSTTSVEGSGAKNPLKLKVQQPKPRTGPGPR